MKIKSNALVIFSLYAVILFVFVNALKYNNGEFYFSITNFSKLTLGINKDKFELFISFLTIGGIVLAISQWMYNISVRQKTDLNGLLEEIHHNFNILGNFFLRYENESLFFAKIYQILPKQNGLVYPNPDNPNFNKEFFKDCIQMQNSFPILPHKIFYLRKSFIEKAITSDNIFSLTKHRVFINLGHLYYSISRHNLNIEKYNSINDNERKVKYLKNIRDEYYTWLHFRLSFILVDLIMNTNEKHFIDKEYVQYIKSHIRNSKLELM